jgi:hypothetical protein
MAKDQEREHRRAEGMSGFNHWVLVRKDRGRWFVQWHAESGVDFIPMFRYKRDAAAYRKAMGMQATHAIWRADPAIVRPNARQART